MLEGIFESLRLECGEIDAGDLAAKQQEEKALQKLQKFKVWLRPGRQVWRMKADRIKEFILQNGEGPMIRGTGKKKARQERKLQHNLGRISIASVAKNVAEGKKSYVTVQLLGLSPDLSDDAIDQWVKETSVNDEYISWSNAKPLIAKLKKNKGKKDSTNPEGSLSSSVSDMEVEETNSSEMDGEAVCRGPATPRAACVRIPI
jgi:hypothetical protein